MNPFVVEAVCQERVKRAFGPDDVAEVDRRFMEVLAPQGAQPAYEAQLGGWLAHPQGVRGDTVRQFGIAGYPVRWIRDWQMKKYLGMAPGQVQAPRTTELGTVVDEISSMNPPATEAERDVLKGIMQAHELDEIELAAQAPGRSMLHMGHASPEVVLREHNRVRAAFYDYDMDYPLNILGDIRNRQGEEALIQSVLPEFAYGLSDELSPQQMRTVAAKLEDQHRLPGWQEVLGARPVKGELAAHSHVRKPHQVIGAGLRRLLRRAL